MDVIHVRFEITLVAYLMFVKPALPDGSITVLDA